MTHLARPRISLALTTGSLAALLALSSVAPSFSQPLEQASPAPAAAVADVSAAPASSAAGAGLSASALTVSASSTSASAGRVAANRAPALLGSRYEWGSTGGGSYDCSGLTLSAWAAAGVTIPRVSRDQASSLTRVSRSDLQPGDLVFFDSPVSHVEMYVGDGELVGASGSKGRVSTSSLRYRSNIVGYGRP